MEINELCKALIRFDESKCCPFCSKNNWGKHLHDKNCPFYLAYDELGEISEERLSN